MCVLAAEFPSSEHGEVVERRCAVLLDGHRSAEGYPPRWLFRGNAERLVWQDTGQLRDVVDVRLGVVLRLRRPATDDGTDGVEAVLMIVSPREQIERCTPTVLQ